MQKPVQIAVAMSPNLILLLTLTFFSIKPVLPVLAIFSSLLIVPSLRIFVFALILFSFFITSLDYSLNRHHFHHLQDFLRYCLNCFLQSL